MQRFDALLSELRRRKVFRVAGLYVVAAWVVLQAAETLVPLLLLPEWIARAVALLAILGFPLAVAIAWAFDVTPEGVQRSGAASEPADAGAAVESRFARVPASGIVLGVTAALIGLGAYALGPGSRGERDVGERSIAVLPFTNVSGAEENEYFSDGITEDILTRLAGLEGLRVISRTSVMTYKGSDKTVPQIAAELGVRYVLEGSVRRVDDQVRITGQLIDARADEHLWARSYDRRVTDVLALQGDIAAEIARALALEISPEDRTRLGRRPTENTAAYDFYLRGRELLRADAAGPAEQASAIAAAVASLRAALAEDPDFAPAYAVLAEAYFRDTGRDIQTRYDSTLALARRALDLDPRLPEAYVQLGNAHYRFRDHGEPAYDLYRIALQLNPNHVDAWLGLGVTNQQSNREADALENYRRAVALDPNADEAWRTLAMALFALGYFDEAEAAYRRGILNPLRLECQLGHIAYYSGDSTAARQHVQALLAAPRSGFLLNCISVLQLRLGDYAAAEEHLRRYAEELPEAERAPLDLSFAYLAIRTGRNTEAQWRLRRAEAKVRELMAGAPESEGLIRSLARVHALRGERDRAVELLDLAYGRTRSSYVFDVSDVLLQSLRGHPGYEAFLARMKADHEAIRAEVERRGLHR